MLLKLTKKPVKQLSDDQSALPAKATRAVGAGRAEIQKSGGNSRASDCCAMTDN
ncbi:MULTISPECIES: hypothetical protein [Pseudoalteromonas]|uniref:hypothetical protein n=1 Tax=Pseudoalteromonas TaxID=53246 RepID=UPI0014861836|nr:MULTISPECIES: hypothetical protein [Pseudoalteromonas]MCO7187099.1 hypothetical protein [Pseudoalteromonas sp. XMcav2-N]